MKIIGHARGQKCPRCKKMKYCDDCACCEKCGFGAPWLENAWRPWPEKMPACLECGTSTAHTRKCSVTIKAAMS